MGASYAVNGLCILITNTNVYERLHINKSRWPCKLIRLIKTGASHNNISKY